MNAMVAAEKDIYVQQDNPADVLQPPLILSLCIRGRDI